MNAEQPALPILALSSTDPDAVRLVELLKGRGGWLKAVEIIQEFAWVDNESARRNVRDLAEQAAPEILSGQKGYKWIGHATPEEVHHAAAWLEAQAHKMGGRACAVRRRAHELFGG